MKKWIFILSLITLSLPAFAQQSPQALFDQANILLEDAEYPEAMALYRQIEADGYISGPLFLNMGIIATEMDSMGLAKYYFLRSSEFDLTKESALDALDYVNAQFSRQSATLPKLPWDTAVDILNNGPGPKGVFLSGFAFIMIIFVMVILRWFNIYSPKRFSATLITLCSISVFLTGLSFYVDYVGNRYSEGVIIDREIQIRQNPSEEADLVSIGYEGYDITVDHRISRDHPSWIYIRLGNGQYGWIPDQGVKTF